MGACRAFLTAVPALLLATASGAIPPERIVSLSPHITELVFAAGSGDNLIGVAEYSDFPPQAGSIPRVGGHSGLDYEGILALRPDLVLAWPSGNGQQAIAKLQELGLRVETSEPKRLEDIPDEIERIGQLTGNPHVATQRAETLRQRLARLRQAFADRSRLRVFYQIWDRPLMTISGSHILDQAIALCGGINPFADLLPLTPQVNQEAVVLSRPDLLLLPADDKTAARWQQDWQRLAATAAWRFAQLDPDLLQRPTARMFEGVEQLCLAIDQARSELRGVSP